MKRRAHGTAGERLRLLDPGTAIRQHYQNDEGEETAASGLIVATGGTVVLRTASAEGGILRVPLTSVEEHRLISEGGPSHRWVRSPWETPITVQLYSRPLIRFRFERNERSEDKRWP